MLHRLTMCCVLLGWHVSRVHFIFLQPRKNILPVEYLWGPPEHGGVNHGIGVLEVNKQNSVVRCPHYVTLSSPP